MSGFAFLLLVFAVVVVSSGAWVEIFLLCQRRRFRRMFKSVTTGFGQMLKDAAGADADWRRSFNKEEGDRDG